MAFGWHPIYEMENKPFMFETTKQLLNIVPKHQGPWTHDLSQNGRIPMAMKIGQKYDPTRDCREKKTYVQTNTQTCCLNIGIIGYDE